ncbi:MAG: aldo/keto reductase [Rhizobiales bacterium 65-9]|nr:aldo/keto reductase [Hyphomicrobiales bacterium]OJY37947.1 MAG: aldo/keto reductase [Rhizobiales bacterium 65-9]
MEQRLLGGTGFYVPILSFGTATFGGGSAFLRAWGASDVKEATRLVDVCLDAGCNMFDSADSYSAGLAEEILGQAIGGRRDRVIISSKTTFRLGGGPNDVGSSRHRLISACEAALRRLRTDYIDLWQMHGFDALTPVEETVRALDDLVRAGKVRYVGVSNFSGWHLMKSLAVAERRGWSRYVAHQVYYSLMAREYEWELMPLGLDQNVGALVWSPLSGGQLTGKIARDRLAPADSRFGQQGSHGPEFPRDQLYDIVDALEEIARDVGRSVSQVALNWVMHRPTVSSVIIGARNEEQLKDNLRAAEFRLTPEQVRRLDEASARPAAYPYWHQRRTSPDRNPPPV